MEKNMKSGAGDTEWPHGLGFRVFLLAAVKICLCGFWEVTLKGWGLPHLENNA